MNVATRKKLSHHALALAISATLSISASTAFAADADRQIADGTIVTVPAGSIETTGQFAHALEAINGGSIVATSTGLTTHGERAQGIFADSAGSSVSLIGGSITVDGTDSGGGLARNGGALTVDGTAITVSGDGVHGLAAFAGGQVTTRNSNIEATGTVAHGVDARDAGSRLEISDSNIHMTGNNASGMFANLGGLLTADRVDIHTEGNTSYGVLVGSGTLEMRDSTIRTDGDYASGVLGTIGAQIDLRNSSITTAGSFNAGVHADGDALIKADGVEISTAGTAAVGVLASGADASIIFNGGKIQTTGASSKGAQAIAGASMQLNQLNIDTSGTGVQASDESRVDMSDVTVVTHEGYAHGIEATGTGAVVTGSNVRSTTEGEHAYGLRANNGGLVDLDSVTVSTRGGYAHGAVAEFGADLQLVNSQVRAEGVGAVGADVIGSTLGMSGGTLFSVQDSAIRSAGGDITLAAAAQISAGNGVFVEQVGDDASTVRMQDRVVAVGDIVFGSGASAGATTLQLSNDSAWIGKTAGVIDDLSIASGSRWQMTSDSQVGQLSLDHGIVAFDPTTTGTFKTLTVSGDFNAENGLLLMNTALGDDRSGTDKLHVLGNTSGTAGVAVNNLGGLGAETQDGIQIIQVDGRSDAQFDLSGRAVAGQYEYFLHQGGKSDPNDGDWYLRSEMSLVDPGTDPGTNPVIDPPAPVQRPEGGAYLANQAAAVGMFDLTLHERVGEPNFAERQRSGDNLGSVWVRTTSDHSHYRINDQLAGQGRQSVLQIGTDLTHWGSEDRGVLGVMAASGQSRSQVASDLTGYSAQGRVDGRAFGLYATWIQGAQNDGGLYVDSWLQAARFKNSVQGDALAQENYRSRSTAASLEAGYAMRLTNNANSAVYLEPQVQAIWTDYRMEGGNHQEVNGTVVNKGDAGGLQTRVGARLYGHATAETGNRVQPFVAVNWIRNPSHANSVWMDQTMLEGVVPRDVYEAKAGVQLQLSPRLTGWGELNTQRGAYGFSSMGAQIGVKYAW